MRQVKIAVLGSHGQVGQSFKQIANQYSAYSFDFFDRDRLDILDKNALAKTLLGVDYKYVINCAAYTKVDQAESESAICMAVNAMACQYLTEIMRDTEMRLVHFSSDYLYHQYNGFPLKESDNPNPQSVYARSKYEGEKIIRNSAVPSIIIRTSWVVSPFGHNFVKTMIKLGNEKPCINVVNDQYGSITYAYDLANTVMLILEKVSSNPDLIPAFNDTYNYANEGIITWYDIATAIMKLKHLPCDVFPLCTKEYPTAAVRPQWSVLSKRKIKNQFNIEIPHWFTSLKACLANL